MRHWTNKRSKRRAFTLVELIVVLVVVSLILTTLLVATQQSRRTARRLQCQSNLRQIGVAMEQYLDVRGRDGKYPDAAVVPSITPNKPGLHEILLTFADDERIFACPDDLTYYEKEGLSYEYPSRILAGKTRQQVLVDRRGQAVPATLVWIAFDFEDFHGPQGEDGSRNFLYADGHVEAR